MFVFTDSEEVGLEAATLITSATAYLPRIHAENGRAKLIPILRHPKGL